MCNHMIFNRNMMIFLQRGGLGLFNVMVELNIWRAHFFGKVDRFCI